MGASWFTSNGLTSLPNHTHSSVALDGGALSVPNTQIGAFNLKDVKNWHTAAEFATGDLSASAGLVNGQLASYPWRNADIASGAAIALAKLAAFLHSETLDNAGHTFAMSTSTISIGVGINGITPATTRTMVALSANAAIAAGVSGITALKISLYRNTTGIPTSGTAVGGDTEISTHNVDTANLVGHSFLTIPIVVMDTVVAGTTYYYYIAITWSGTSGNITIGNGTNPTSIVAVPIPA